MVRLSSGKSGAMPRRLLLDSVAQEVKSTARGGALIAPATL